MATAPIPFKRSRTFKGSVKGLRPFMDPQNWKTNIPDLWKESAVIATNGLSADRKKNPKTISKRGKKWSGLFFEDVTFGEISRQRNVLRASYTELHGARGLEKIIFDYVQHECLDSEYLGELSDGGVDVDHGQAVCEKAGAGEVTLTISKTVRFTNLPPGWIYETFAAVAVNFVMEYLLLGVPGQKD